jgi:hypothetical protein
VIWARSAAEGASSGPTTGLAAPDHGETAP